MADEVEEKLEEFECPMKTQTALCVAIEELFVNVARYAYGEGEGDMTLGIGFDNESREITFRMTDKGVAFDPLKKPDPDITLSAEEREIGGLGIFITKKTMDSISYAYENNENVLTMIKNLFNEHRFDMGITLLMKIKMNILNMEITNGAAGLVLPKVVTLSIMYIMLVVSIIVIVNFGRSAPGRACISIREDEIASEAMGINTTKYKIIAFVIGALIATWAGALYAGNFYIIKPEMFTYNKSIDVLVIVVFGGMGSITGSVIAAIVLGLINSFLQSFSGIRMIIYGIALILIMIFRPSGLLGTKEFTFSELLSKFKKEVKS